MPSAQEEHGPGSTSWMLTTSPGNEKNGRNAESPPIPRPEQRPSLCWSQPLDSRYRQHSDHEHSKHDPRDQHRYWMNFKTCPTTTWSSKSYHHSHRIWNVCSAMHVVGAQRLPRSWEDAAHFATMVDTAAEYFGSWDETCEVYFAHYECIMPELCDGVYPAELGTRAHQREMAGASRPPVLPLRGLSAEAWTLVLAAKKDQVLGAPLRRDFLDPHLHRVDHGVMGSTGRLLDDCWALGDGDEGAPGVALICVGARAAFNIRGRKPFGTQKVYQPFQCPSGH